MPNELYVIWLKEWVDKAFETQSKGYKTLRSAYASMLACPFDIGHPSQAAQLKFIGPVLCARLEKRLLAHCKENDLPMPSRADETVEADTEPAADSCAQAVPAKKKRPPKQYVPAVRSGAYAILMALSEPGIQRDLPRSDVINLAKAYCDQSFEVASDKHAYYTAWNSMKTLKEKDLVIVVGHPPKYTISPEGAEIANKMRKAEGWQCASDSQETLVDPVQRSNVDRIEDDDMPLELPAPRSIVTPFAPIVVPAGTFKVQMIIDNREVKSPKDRTFIEDHLHSNGIDLVTKALDVGDILWIAKTDTGKEYVLDHIVERKRMDDLLGSIKDGRFHEQKFRLSKCGAKHVIYLIEETHMTEVPHYIEALQTAISSTQVVNGFFVKRVPSLDYSVRYLCRLTKKLKTLYEDKTLYIIPDHMIDRRTLTSLRQHLRTTHPDRSWYLSYDSFSSISKKTTVVHVGELWLRMLMTIRGVSAEKALEIQLAFPTLQHLLGAYAACAGDSERDTLMTRRCRGYGRKSIGVALSKKIAGIFK